VFFTGLDGACQLDNMITKKAIKTRKIKEAKREPKEERK
jgi:hypothetical protein